MLGECAGMGAGGQQDWKLEASEEAMQGLERGVVVIRMAKRGVGSQTQVSIRVCFRYRTLEFNNRLEGS